MKEAEDTRKQNVTLLVFTVVTVIFVSGKSMYTSGTHNLPLLMLNALLVANVIHIQRFRNEQ